MIDIIITTYNSENFISRCLDSVVDQTNKNFNVIIVDDGSSDNTLNICENFRNKINNITIYRNKHEGIANQRNFALSKLVSDYFIFLDSDDTINPELIFKLQSSIKDSSCDLIRYGADRYENRLYANYYDKFDLRDISGKEFITYCSLNNKRFGPLWLYCYSKQFINNNHFRFINNLCYEDFYNNYIILMAKKIKFINYVGYNYYKNNNSITNKNSMPQNERLANISKIYRLVTKKIHKQIKSDKQIEYIIQKDLFGFLIQSEKYFSDKYLQRYIKIKDKFLKKVNKLNVYKNYICSRCILIENNNLCVIFRNKDNKQFYVFPGGHLEKGEDVYACVVREAKEELNIDIIPIKPLYIQMINGEKQLYILCKKIKGELSVTNAEEYVAADKKGHYIPTTLELNDKKCNDIKPVEIFEQLYLDNACKFDNTVVKTFKLKY